MSHSVEGEGSGLQLPRTQDTALRALAGLPLEIAGPNPPVGGRRRVPGAMVNLGSRPAGDGPVVPNHSNRMRIDEAAGGRGVAGHAAVALRFLDRGSTDGETTWS